MKKIDLDLHLTQVYIHKNHPILILFIYLFSQSDDDFLWPAGCVGSGNSQLWAVEGEFPKLSK